jgi:hypothetical protein
MDAKSEKCIVIIEESSEQSDKESPKKGGSRFQNIGRAATQNTAHSFIPE